MRGAVKLHLILAALKRPRQMRIISSFGFALSSLSIATPGENSDSAFCSILDTHSLLLHGVLHDVTQRLSPCCEDFRNSAGTATPDLCETATRCTKRKMVVSIIQEQHDGL